MFISKNLIILSVVIIVVAVLASSITYIILTPNYNLSSNNAPFIPIPTHTPELVTTYATTPGNIQPQTPEDLTTSLPPEQQPTPDIGFPVTTTGRKVTVLLSKDSYKKGEVVTVTVANGLFTNSIYTQNQQSNCSIVTVERWHKNEWVALDYCGIGGQPSSAIQIGSQRAQKADLDIATLIQYQYGQYGNTPDSTVTVEGIYRIKFAYGIKWPEGSTEKSMYESIETVYSQTFLIHPNEFNTIDKTQLKKFCEEKGGTWLSEYSECASSNMDKGLNGQICTELGGVFNGCASGCRHQKSTECTFGCIKVCNFE